MKLRQRIAGIATAMVCAAGAVCGGSSLIADAETTGTYGDLTYSTVDSDGDGTDDYVEITDCDQSATSVEIPAEIDGLPVTSVRDYAFFNCTSLESITIPDSVTNIGMFYNCTSLESINVSENNEYYSSIDGVLFSKDNSELILYPVNKSDESYTIPETVKTIGWDSFSDCNNLISIMIPDNVEKIGLNSHIYNQGITIGSKKLLSIDVSPDNMYYSSVDGVLFNKDQTILLKYPCQKPETSYTIPESVVEINDCAFSDCENLKTVLIKDNITVIGSSAFENCTSLQSVIIPDSVTVIQCGCFKGCSSLVSVKLSEKLTRIWGDTFMECTSLKSLQIPASVEQIDTDYGLPGTGGGFNSAFYKCNSLENIKVDPDNTKYADIDGVLFNKEKDSIIYYPAGKSNTEYSIPEGVTSIEGWAFAYGVNLKTLKIPDSVMTIYDWSFLYRTGLENIYVSENSEYYSSIDGVLFNKSKTTLIKYPEEKQNSEYIIPDSVTSIYYYAFFDCSYLESLTIPDSVTAIKCDIFCCEKLKSITIPDSVTTINCYIYDCEELTSITIKNPECEISCYLERISDELIIYGYENSTAQAYAEKYNRNFVSLSEYTPVVQGDISGNGAIDLYDAIEICKSIMGMRTFTDEEKSIADYDGNGVVDLYDAIGIARELLPK